MLKQKEKKLLKFIKYSPIVLTTVIAIIVNIFVYIQNSISFDKEIEEYKINYVENQKFLVKAQVEKVYKDILIENKNLEIDVKNNLKMRINEAYTIIENIYNNYKHLDEKSILAIIKSTLRNIRFNENRGYYYLHKMSGLNILHPIKPSLEDTNIINIRDKRGVYILQDIVDNLKIKDGYFSTLYWNKPNDMNNEYEKITYNRVFKPLNLIIGTGDYRVDFTNNLKKHVLKEHVQRDFYGKNGYVFVVDFSGNYLAHIKQAYIGKNRINLVDANGFEITKEIINTAKKGNGYIRYIGTIMPETGKAASKTTYIKGFDDWKWAIATGFYDKELNRNLAKKKNQLIVKNNEYMKKILLISFLLALSLISISIYISKVLEGYFTQYHHKIVEEINNNRKKDTLLNQQTKMASMGEMIGNIAHQWRQPLSVISTAASGIKLEKEFGLISEKKQNEALDAILNSTEYLSHTIEDFQNFFKPDKMKAKINTKEMYGKILKLISSRLINDKIHIKANVEEIKINTFGNELMQSIINILNNSFDALEEKEIDNKLIFLDIKHIHLSSNKNKELSNSLQIKDGEYLIIVIKDNAGGIPEDIINKIYEAYFTTKHQSRGTGIGLYMTYEIITRNLSGEIEAKNVEYEYENERYSGAEFTIYLSMKDN